MSFLANIQPAIGESWARPRTDLHTKFLYLLGIVLAGYALLGKGFAYVGYPPLLIGEVTMVLGLFVIFRSRCGLAMLTTLPSVLLLMLLTLVVVRTATCFGQYGMDAIRDSVIVVYGLYAFIVVALLLEDPKRLTWLINAYGRLAWLYGFIGGSLTYITTGFASMMPIWPLSGVSIVYVRLGEAASHLAGVAIFALLGLRKVTVLWTLALFVGIVMITPSRGAMVACVGSIGVAVVLSGQIRRFMPVLLVGTGVLLVFYVAGLDIPLPGGRTLGPGQIISNVESLIGTSQAANLDGTKEWRLRWWQAIQDYTFRGPYFWTGKGYGLGLAEADGFVVGRELGGPMVRSPHNAHLTMLARSGVPGLVLWVATGLAWFAMLLRNVVLAKRRKETHWANIFIWIACYALAIVIDASFDVALEGPMLGIWFWSLFGLGIAASMIYRWEVSEDTRRQFA
jgi:O-Antigen ligase